MSRNNETNNDMDSVQHRGLEMIRHWVSALACVGVLGVAVVLSACGGSDDAAPATPPALPSVPVIGAGGGTVTDNTGAAVTVPPGALTSDVTLRIARDSAGAPPLPEGVTILGEIYAITPHGQPFEQLVEVRLPLPAAALQSDERFVIVKTTADGQWEVQQDSVVNGGTISARISGFSWVGVSLTTNVLLFNRQPQVTCGSEPCIAVTVTRPTVSATWEVARVPRLPSQCSASTAYFSLVSSYATASGQVTEELGRWPFSAGGAGSISAVAPLVSSGSRWNQVQLRCPPRVAGRAGSIFGGWGMSMMKWQVRAGSFDLVQAPATLDVVAGTSASLSYVFYGGGSRGVQSSGYVVSTPTFTDRAVIDWRRSTDGRTWTDVARGYETEANPRPFSTERTDWWFWSLTHAFVPTAADQGTLIGVRACYLPPGVTGSGCRFTPGTRLNVVQLPVAPNIATAPASVLVRVGETANFSAAVSGAPAPTLQWQARPANSTGPWTDVIDGFGANAPSYTTGPMTLADNGRQYRAVVTNALGSVATLPVIVAVNEFDVAPTITAQPGSLAVPTGSDAAFAIAATGTEALGYQWRFNGQPIAGENGPLLRLPSVTNAQAGRYSVQVSNRAGSVVSDDATLTVNPTAGSVAPTIVTQPVPVTVNAGNTATLAVSASGSALLAYQWLRNGTPIPGATAAFHSIAAAAAGDAGSYTVRISNGITPDVTSNAATLTVNPSAQAAAVAIVSHPSPQVRPVGGSVTFTVAFTGSGPVSYQWLKNGSPIAGATGGSLHIATIAGSDDASYAVTITNALGSATTNAARLLVLGVPMIGTSPTATTVNEGTSATFSVASSGSDLQFQWTRNSVAIPGATTASYTTPALVPSDSGAVYGVIVYNRYGVAISAPAVLTVNPALTITWGTPRVLATGNVDSPAAGIDDLGRGLVVFTNQTTTARMVAMSGQVGSSWGGATFIDSLLNATGGAFAPRLAVAPDGAAVAVFGFVRSGIPSTYHVAVARGSTAGMEQAVVLGSFFSGDRFAAAIDDYGRSVVIWNGNSLYANFSTPGTNWSEAFDLARHVGFGSGAGEAQVAVSSTGRGFIVVQGGFPGSSANAIAAIPVDLATGTVGTDIAYFQGRLGFVADPQVAVDENGGAVVMYYSSAQSNYEAIARHYTPGVGWTGEIVVDTDVPFFARNLVVASDGAGNAIAAWMKQTTTRASNGSSFNVAYTSRYVAGAGWSVPELRSAPEVDGVENIQIAASRGGRFVVSWIDFHPVTFEQMSTAAVYDGGWTPPTRVQTDVNAVGFIGRDPLEVKSLAVAPSNGRALLIWGESDRTTRTDSIVGAFLP